MKSTSWESTAWESTAWESTAWESAAWESTAWESAAWHSRPLELCSAENTGPFGKLLKIFLFLNEYGKNIIYSIIINWLYLSSHYYSTRCNFIILYLMYIN